MKHEGDQTPLTIIVLPYTSDFLVNKLMPISLDKLANQIINFPLPSQAHIQTTLDLPELDFSGALRETTSRMENMISNNRNGAAQNNGRPNSDNNSGGSGDMMHRSHTTLH